MTSSATVAAYVGVAHGARVLSDIALRHLDDIDVIAATVTRVTSWVPGVTLTTASRHGAETLTARLGLGRLRETADGTQVHADGMWGGVAIHIAGVLAPDETPGGVSDPADADRHDTTTHDQATDQAIHDREDAR